MKRGIVIFGLNGGGKSTLTHGLAKRTGYFEMDAEDYYFPEQKASRMWALENDEVGKTVHLGDMPFSIPRTKREVEAALLQDIGEHPEFILSGVRVEWSEEILSHIGLAFWVQAPMEERLRRIQAREEKRFGARVLAGGDMYEQQLGFRKMVERRDETAVAESAKRLSCPVIVLDGTLPVEENLERMLENLKEINA